MARLTLILSVIGAVVALLGGFQWVLGEWRAWRARLKHQGKWLGLLLAFCVLPSLADAACSGSGLTWTCTSGSTSAQIQSAMNSADDGATITLDNGTYTASAELIISNTKGVTLICQTVRGCTVTTTGTWFGCFCISGTNSKLYRVSGFIFDGNGTAAPNGVVWLDAASSTRATLTQFRVDNNTFQNAAYGAFYGVFTCSGDTGKCDFHGLIDHNIWSNATLLVAFGHIGSVDDTAAKRGTVNNIFLEDNQLTFTNIGGASGIPCTDGWGGMSSVVRFNTGTNCTWGGHGAKHGGGQQNAELYGNVIALNDGAIGSGQQDCYRCYHHQGSGEILVWGNRLSTTQGKNAEVIAVNDYRGYTNGNGDSTFFPVCDGTVVSPPAAFNDGNRTPIATYRGYPCYHQAGRDFNLLLKPSYVWDNLWSDTGATIDFISSDAGTGFVNEHLQTNRDWYNAVSANAQTSPTSPFNGTTGMGFGTLANRPTTCTATPESADAGYGGVGYWATDQGSWNTSTSNPYGVQRNGADGVLYQCTATNTWTIQYTPYTYPHPLQGQGGAGGDNGLRTIVTMRGIQIMEFVLPVLSLGWHFRRQVVAGVVACVSLGASGTALLNDATQTTKVSTRAVAERVAVAYLRWQKPKT